MEPEKPEVDTETEGAQFIEEGPSLPALLTEDFVKQFEKGVEVYKRWVSVCYRLTRESHWLCRKDKYALQGPGAEALMNPLGISFERPTFRKEEDTDDKGSFYRYWCEGYVESKTLGRRGWYIGFCDSRDEFFNARPGWNSKSGEGDIKKSAMMNWLVNSVSRIAGIRDPSPESLQSAGLDLTKIHTVDYSGRKTPEADSNKISEAQGKRLWALCKENNVSEVTLRAYLSETYHLLSMNDIPRGQYNQICAWVMQGGKEVKP